MLFSGLLVCPELVRLPLTGQARTLAQKSGDLVFSNGLGGWSET